MPVFFAKPSSNVMPLAVQPRLASWMAAGHPDQVRLGEFVAYAEALLTPQLSGLNGPLALRSDVGLPSTKPLLDQHDLDNYAFPLATRLAKRVGRQFAAVWCSKRHSQVSKICVAPATAAKRAAARLPWTEVHTTASAGSTDYKQQIHDQLAAHDPLPEGPVSLQMSFTVGRRRSWPNLWKPTIDALDQILGRTTPGRQWHPRDGRIVELGLHCRVDDTVGNDVRIAIAATIHSR